MTTTSINTIHKNRNIFTKNLYLNLSTSTRLVKIQNKEIKEIAERSYDTTSVSINKDNGYTINAGKYRNSSGFWTKDIKIKIRKTDYFLAFLGSFLKSIKQSKKKSWIIHSTTVLGIILVTKTIT